MSYHGGKGGNGVHQTLINQIPEHDIYVEPFLGGGAVAVNLTLPESVYLLELSKPAVDRFRKLNPELRTKVGQSCGLDFLELSLPMVAADKRKFLFCDPPYIKATRKDPRDIYEHEWTNYQHVRFLRILQQLGRRDDVFVMVTHYPCELYTAALSDWRTFTFQAMTRSGLATEQVWMNYPEPVRLQDYRYLGNDRREREKIRRRVNNWRNGLLRMPPRERLAIYHALKEVVEQ